MDTVERRTMKKVFTRLIPFLTVCYLVAYLDRVNVGFAALEMNKDLGLSASAFGLGAGIFFVTYFICEVPSNLLLVRFGARRWIARIMLTWGLVSGATAFTTGQTSFYILRLLLGVAEAGFFPGIVFFLTMWFPSAYRARVMGYFLIAAPLSSVIGGPISGALLSLDGSMGLHGWQWLFILEAVPAVLLSGIVLLFLQDRPADAGWLAPSERNWLGQRIAAEEQKLETVSQYSLVQVFFNPRVLLLSLTLFLLVLTIYGVSFFLPQIVKGFGMSNLETGFISAIPYAVAVVGVVWWGRRSDATKERRIHTALPALIAGLALATAALVENPAAKMIAFSIAAFGSFGALPAFWATCTNMLSGPAAAVGIAAINAISILAGFFGPVLMGLVKEHTGSFAGGLFVLAAVAIVAGGIVMVLRDDSPREVEVPRIQPVE
jgi:MFS transporter, ACS family, tartrate transporter